MKIIRFLKQNKEAFGNLHEDNHVTLLEGDIASGFSDTGALATVEKILAPILPSDILCIGLNYKRHATETGVVPPEHPILFLKNTGSLQHPEDPVILPRKLRSEKVDYECELAVVLGKRCTTSVETKPTNTYSGTHAPMTSQLVTGRKTVAADNGVEARHLQRSVHLDP